MANLHNPKYECFDVTCDIPEGDLFLHIDMFEAVLSYCGMHGFVAGVVGPGRIRVEGETGIKNSERIGLLTYLADEGFPETVAVSPILGRSREMGKASQYNSVERFIKEFQADAVKEYEPYVGKSFTLKEVYLVQTEGDAAIVRMCFNFDSPHGELSMLSHEVYYNPNREMAWEIESIAWALGMEEPTPEFLERLKKVNLVDDKDIEQYHEEMN